MKQPRRLALIVLSVLALLAAGAPAASAGQPHRSTHKVTLSEFRQYLASHDIGPSRYTDGGTMTIKLPGRDMNCNCYRPVPTLHAPCSTCGKMTPAESQTSRADALHYLDGHWWDPTSWDWGGIFGDIWNSIKACAEGGDDAALGALGTGAAMKALGFGSTVAKVTPEGALTIVIAGCIGGIIANS